MPLGKLTGALQWRSVGPYTGGRVTTVAGVPEKPNVFYMGTAGGGVWESDDYGRQWKNISDKDFKSSSIGAMAIAPSNSKIIYAGTGDSAPRNTVLTGEGMYKSTDGGKTWKKILYVNDGTGAISLAMDPSNPSVLYAAMWQISRKHWTFASGGAGSGPATPRTADGRQRGARDHG